MNARTWELIPSHSATSHAASCSANTARASLSASRPSGRDANPAVAPQTRRTSANVQRFTVDREPCRRLIEPVQCIVDTTELAQHDPAIEQDLGLRTYGAQRCERFGRSRERGQ